MTRPSQPHAQPKVHEDQHPPLANLRTVEEARQALADHQAACPGTALECFGNPALERTRQAWVEAKALLVSDLELAERLHAATWRNLPVQPMEPSMPTKKTDQEKLVTMLTRLDRLIADGKNRQASCLRSQIRSHCESCGFPVPALPVNPNPKPGILKKAHPEVTNLEDVLAPPQGSEPVAQYAQLDRVLGLPEGTVGQAAESATHRPDLPPDVREIIAAGGHDALVRRAKRMLGDAADLLKEATRADGEDLAAARTVLGNLDALVHLVHLYAAEGRIEVSA